MDSLHQRLVKFIEPFVRGTQQNRISLIGNALRDSPALQHLEWGGGSLLFAEHLVKTVETWGGAADLRRLITGLAQNAGIEQQAVAEQLCRDLQPVSKPDPESLDQAVQSYTAELRRAIKADLLEKLFVEEVGDKQTLEAPINEAYAGFLDYDIGWLEALHTASAAEVTGRDRSQAGYVDNVRAYLLHQVERGVLLGEPGSGKTWTLLLVLLDACRGWQVTADTSRIAVLVKLNQFKGFDPATKAPLSFAEFVRRSAAELAPHLDNLAQNKRLLLLCDALNEMPRTAPDGRDLLAEVTSYLAQLPFFIVSCRYHDYKNDLQALYPLEQVRLRDLELPAIRAFLDNYLPPQPAIALWNQMGGSEDLFTFWREVNERGEAERFWDAQAGIPSYTSVAGDEAWRAMHSGTRLIPLCRKPYLGFLLTSIYRADGDIPANRSALFGGFVQQLLARERANAAKRGQTFPIFELISAALTGLANVLQQAKSTTLPADAVPPEIDAGLLDAAAAASLLEFDGKSWRFSHQLLQEYFAARILLAAMEQGQNPADIFDGNWWEAGVWRETAVILGEVADPDEVAIWLAPHNPELALTVLLENSEWQAGPMRLSAAARQALSDNARLRTSEENIIGRAAAYRVLGHPLVDVDHRQGVYVISTEAGPPLPDIDWVLIPDDGPWTYQDDKHPGLPPFEISRYPITYAQFQTFVDDPQGFNDPQKRWFAGLAADNDDRQLAEQAFKYLNHPRERVNWYQAIAFCRWLSWRWSGGYDLDHILAWAVRLPTELEWEKAARGRDGRTYPYGNEFDPTKGNTSKTGLEQTSAVGLFPQGASPYGVEEMSGNVWEWCLTAYEQPAPDAAQENISSTARRVVRGGSWYYDHLSARAAFRNDFDPFSRYDDRGFRVCRPPSL